MPKSLIGNTPLEQIPELCEAYNLPNLWIKSEDKNPTGTWKDRRSQLVVQHLRHSDPERRHVCMVTAGNTALSIKAISNGMRLEISAIVSPDIAPEVADSMTAMGIRLIYRDLKNPLSTEEIQKLAKQSEKDNPLDISSLMHNAYNELIHEIERQTKTTDNKPDYIVAPYGTGEALYGLAEHNYRSQIYQPHHAARLVGVKPVTPERSLADKLDGHIVPYHHWLQEFRKDGLIEQLVTEEEIDAAYRTVAPYLSVEPSSATPFAALGKLKLKPEDKVIVINSGRGIYPQSARTQSTQIDAVT